MSSAVVTVLETQLMSGSIEPDYINDMSEFARNAIEHLRDEIDRIYGLAEGLELVHGGEWAHMRESEVVS
jgi:hypothetical protein